MMRDRIFLEKIAMEKESNGTKLKIYKTTIFPQFFCQIPHLFISQIMIRVVEYLHTCGFMNLGILIEYIECKQAINADCTLSLLS